MLQQLAVKYCFHLVLWYSVARFQQNRRCNFLTDLSHHGVPNKHGEGLPLTEKINTYDGLFKAFLSDTILIYQQLNVYEV